MIQRILGFPWGRTACVVGAVWAFLGIETSPWAAPVFITMVFAAVALHGLAIWRDKP